MCPTLTQKEQVEINVENLLMESPRDDFIQFVTYFAETFQLFIDDQYLSTPVELTVNWDAINRYAKCYDPMQRCENVFSLSIGEHKGVLPLNDVISLYSSPKILNSFIEEVHKIPTMIKHFVDTRKNKYYTKKGAYSGDVFYFDIYEYVKENFSEDTSGLYHSLCCNILKDNKFLLLGA